MTLEDTNTVVGTGILFRSINSKLLQLFHNIESYGWP
jgi:hypothetical protein